MRVWLWLTVMITVLVTSSHHTQFSDQLAVATTPRNILGLAVKVQDERVLSSREMCGVFKMLVRLDGQWCCRDASGARVPGLNATMLMFHKPFAQQRASIVRAAAVCAPSLSGGRSAKLLHAASNLAHSGFAGAPLCTALATRVLDKSHALSPRACALALQSIGRLGVCDDWLTNSLASAHQHEFTSLSITSVCVQKIRHSRHCRGRLHETSVYTHPSQFDAWVIYSLLWVRLAGHTGTQTQSAPGVDCARHSTCCRWDCMSANTAQRAAHFARFVA